MASLQFATSAFATYRTEPLPALDWQFEAALLPLQLASFTTTSVGPQEERSPEQPNAPHSAEETVPLTGEGHSDRAACHQRCGCQDPLYDLRVIDPAHLSPKALCPKGSTVEPSLLSHRNHRRGARRACGTVSGCLGVWASTAVDAHAGAFHGFRPGATAFG
jgi:hypothetical protein